MGRAELWIIRAVLGLILLLIIGAVVGGVLYGPRLRAAMIKAEQGKADTAVSQAETEYATRVGTEQARTQAAEVTVNLQTQESVREIQAARGADALLPPDVYGAFADGVRINRAGGGAGGAGEGPAARTADPQP